MRIDKKCLIATVSIALLLTGCNDESTQRNVSTNSGVVDLTPLYPPTVTTPAIPLEPSTPVIKTVSIKKIRGNIHCEGECELSVTGNRNAEFEIELDKISHEYQINARSKSMICYEMESGWFVMQYFYQGKVWMQEAVESCYHGTYEVDASQWDGQEVKRAVVDVRSTGDWEFGERVGDE